jgi:hypothetical protein
MSTEFAYDDLPKFLSLALLVDDNIHKEGSYQFPRLLMNYPITV